MRSFCILAFMLSITLLNQSARSESPLHKNSTADKILLSGVILGGAGLLYFENQLQPLTESQINDLERKNVNWLDRQATRYYSKRAGDISDWGMFTALLMPLAFFADKSMHADALPVALMYVKTMAVTGIATELAKVSVRRTRPYAYNTNVPIQSKMALDTRKSFFSGHTSTAFAGAVFTSKVFSDYHPESRFTPLVWLGTLSLSSSVAYARVRAGKHFPTDVFVAALVGSACGYLIPDWYKKNGKSSPAQINASTEPMMIGITFVF